MHLVGKRGGRPSIAQPGAGNVSNVHSSISVQCDAVNSLCFLNDNLSNRLFLIDTGAELSVVPATNLDKQFKPPTRPLIAANGSSIATYGKRKLQFQIGSETFEWNFTIAAVERPLLGADFLRHSGLLVDVRSGKLVRPDTYQVLQLSTAVFTQNSISAGPVAPNSCEAVVHEFPTLLTPTFDLPSVQHGVNHHIVTQGPPVSSKVRRLAPDRLRAAREEFQHMLDLGIIRRSRSQWASPLHMVPKPGGGWRACGDFRRLNCITDDDRYPVPHIHDFAANLAGNTVFSKIDLVRGYHQIPVAKSDIAKTAVITPFGLFEFLRMPFGLKCAAQTFQRLMDSICADLDFLFIYLDDILVASKSLSEHKHHLRTLFKRLADNGLIINREKCEFAKAKLNFLGYTVDCNGAIPPVEKVQAIVDFPSPTTKKGLSEFIGMVVYYHRFIPHAAAILKPLHQAKAQLKSNRQKLVWSTEMCNAFNKIKSELANATMLAHPVEGAPLALVSDASDIAVGAVLQQFHNNSWQPLAFYSKHLRQNELQYSAFDKQLLALYLSIRHFRCFVEGRSFVAFTDHKPLVSAIHKMADSWSKRQRRHLSCITEFTTDVRHISGMNNVVADMLSRPAICSTQLSIDYEAMAREQADDPDIQAMRTAISSLKLGKVQVSGVSLLCDTSQKSPRPLVPTSMRRAVFQAVHGLSHPGINATVKLITARFMWHGISRDARLWTKECVACQTSKIRTHTKAPTSKIDMPQRRFDHIHVDIVGPLPTSQGFTHLFTIVDRFTRWPAAIPIKGTDSHTCARALLTSWIADRGVPAHISSDRGAQFTSQLWRYIAEFLGSSLHKTTAYHPQANGLVERFHRQLKECLKARLTGPNWIDQLPWVLLGIRTTPKVELDASPAEMVYGSALTVPADLVCEPSEATTTSQHLKNLRNTVGNLVPTPTSCHGTTRPQVPKSLLTCEYVFVQRGLKSVLRPPYEGPFKVLTRKDKTFTIAYNGREEVVSIDRLKPAHLSLDFQVPQPTIRKRGRPRKQ